MLDVKLPASSGKHSLRWRQDQQRNNPCTRGVKNFHAGGRKKNSMYDDDERGSLSAGPPTKAEWVVLSYLFCVNGCAYSVGSGSFCGHSLSPPRTSRVHAGVVHLDFAIPPLRKVATEAHTVMPIPRGGWATWGGVQSRERTEISAGTMCRSTVVYYTSNREKIRIVHGCRPFVHWCGGHSIHSAALHKDFYRVHAHVSGRCLKIVAPKQKSNGEPTEIEEHVGWAKLGRNKS